ncbi:MAG: 50S ribosomal protein L31 [Chloroflexi bacterium]|nr:50S ribosomal protein L31 [Chloroflexota bacterium]
MKKGIHPTYYPDAVVTCACGNTWTTGSTKKTLKTDVCYKCHPFFTGEQRIVDTAGQVERFLRRLERAAATAPAAQAKAAPAAGEKAQAATATKKAQQKPKPAPAAEKPAA